VPSPNTLWTLEQQAECHLESAANLGNGAQGPYGFCVRWAKTARH
jgi:hypothetical protein